MTDAIAIAIDAPALRTLTEGALRGAEIAFSGPEAVGAASVVLVDASADDPAQMAALRARTRLDAAILVVRAPVVADELVDLVRSALAGVAEVELTDPTRTLGFETHLAAVARVSAGITHEIANPLNVAMTNLEFLREECDDVVTTLGEVTTASSELLPARLEAARARLRRLDQDGGLGGVVREISEAHARIRELLEAMRGVFGKGLKVQLEPIDLLPLAHVVRHLSDASALAGVAVEVSGEPVVAEADRGLLREIIANLTTNAAAAARTRSSPRVRIHVYAEDALAVISIRDNGPGIPPELHDWICEPFYMTRFGTGRTGTGLGLALCREHAVRMGAKLALWSVPGRGTCFRLRLPLAGRGA